MAWLPNPGHLPPECEIWEEVETEDGPVRKITGYRAVHIRTFGSEHIPVFDSQRGGHNPWPAKGGRPDTNWRISNPPHPHEIREFEVI